MKFSNLQNNHTELKISATDNNNILFLFIIQVIKNENEEKSLILLKINNYNKTIFN